MRLVLDANVALDWFLTSPEGKAYSEPLLRRILSGEVTCIVPEHFMYEVSRILVMRGLKGQSPKGRAWLESSMNDLDAMPIDTVVIGLNFHHLGQLAQAYDLDAPDVPYLHMARELGVPIATRDAKVMAACNEWNVELWQP